MKSVHLGWQGRRLIRAEWTRLSRNDSVRREEFNAKAQRREDAKKNLLWHSQPPNDERWSWSHIRFLPLRLLRLCDFALIPCCMDAVKSLQSWTAFRLGESGSGRRAK
jgi:hypothetical protein